MKRFKYRLDTVLDYKIQVLDNLKSEHAVIMQSVNKKEEQITGLTRELIGYEAGFDELRLRTFGSLICVLEGWRR